MNGFNTKRGIKGARLVIAGWLLLGLFIFVAIFADFIAPYDYSEQSRAEPSAPSSGVYFQGTTPVIYSRRLQDPLRLLYSEDQSAPVAIDFFVRGYSYRLFGIAETNVHLFGIANSTAAAPRINLLGTDALGRDRFSRLLYAIRFSLVVCLAGVAFACAIGIVIGVGCGYAGRVVDTALMGLTDAMLALPTLILILAARAAFPLELPPFRAALLLLVIFALTGWAEIARLARGLTISMREREFVLAAVASGLSQTRILFRHILPNVSRPLFTQALLMMPAFLLAEIALSYLGVGLQEPQPSLGNMLTAASDLNLLRSQTFNVLSPAIVVFMFVLAVHLAVKRR